MANLWRKSQQIEFDLEGDIARGALLYFFVANTTTPLTVWQDADLSIPHEHPLEASGAGRWPAIYLPFVSYRERAVTVGGILLFDTPQIDNPAPIEPEEIEIEGYSTGDIKWRIEQPTTEIEGWVRCNGRTIGPPGSGALERANDDCEELFLHRWADSNSTIGGGRGASAQGDWDAGNKTITLPDLRSAFQMGLDDMGNAAAGRLTGNGGKVVPGVGNGAGIQYGTNLHLLITNELPAHNHPVSITSGGATDHVHYLAAFVEGFGGTGSTGAAGSAGAHTHGPGSGLTMLGGTTGPGSQHQHGPNTLAGSTGTAGAHIHGPGTGGTVLGGTIIETHGHDIKYDTVGITVATGGTAISSILTSAGLTATGAALSAAHTFGFSVTTGETDEEGEHTHGFSVTTGLTSLESLHTHGFSVTTGTTSSDGAHTHPLTGATGIEPLTGTPPTRHTHPVIGDTGNKGDSLVHNNVPYSIAGTYYQKL